MVPRSKIPDSPSSAGRRSCGPVWCARRGQSAVVSLVGPPDHVAGQYVQWCSLVGVDLTCDENCVGVGARWAAAEVPDGVARDVYAPLCELVDAVQARRDQVGVVLPAVWQEWARCFVAGICSASAAWRAAEAARHQCTALAGDGPGVRQVVLAAEDAAWAAAHAAAGNVSLSLERSEAARRLLKASSGE